MNTSMGISKSVVLAVGQQFHLKVGKDHIIYAGMLSDDVYSIVQKKANGYQGYAWNLFFPKKKQDIKIDGIKLYVEKVSPDEIQLMLA